MNEIRKKRLNKEESVEKKGQIDKINGTAATMKCVEKEIKQSTIIELCVCVHVCTMKTFEIGVTNSKINFVLV